MSFLIDLRHHGLLGRSRLRFYRVSGGDKKKGLGKVTQRDDMIKTMQGKRGESVRRLQVLEVSGASSLETISDGFFKQ